MDPQVDPVARQALSELVSKRSKQLRFEGALSQHNCAGSAVNPYCGDAASVAIRLDGSRHRLLAVRCSVQGCAVCKASADLMAEHLEGLSLHQAAQLSGRFQELLRGGPCPMPLDGPLALFAALRQVPSRATCALLPWQALTQALRLNPSTPMQ